MLRYANPLFWVRVLVQFSIAWLSSFPWSKVAALVPALAMGLVLLTFGVLSFSGSSGWRGRLLDDQINIALVSEDFGVAELLVRRKLTTQPTDAALQFQLASIRDARDAPDEARVTMRRLVATRSHVPAAEWLLRNQYDNRRIDSLTVEEKTEFATLMELLTRERPERLDLKAVYANYLIANQDYQQAIDILRELARVQPIRGMQAALICRRIGNEATAVQLAQRTLERLRKPLKEDPTNTKLVLAVTQIEVFLKDYDAAVQTLRSGLKVAKSDENKQLLSNGLGDVIAVWVGELRKPTDAAPLDPVRVLKMLDVGLRYSPQNPRILSLVVNQVLTTLDNDERQLAAIRRSLVSGASPGIAHFIRGTAALMKDDLERAQTSLRLAAKAIPNSSAILNNLAVALSLRSEEYLKDALKVSEESIRLNQQATPHYYETRGQILFRMKRYVDAIPDLEIALQIPALVPAARKSLAVCYEQIGEPELAKLHQDALAELSRKDEKGLTDDISEIEKETESVIPETAKDVQLTQ